MNREIKFRAKSLGTNEWLYGGFLSFEDGTVIMKDNKDEKDDKMFTSPVDPKTLGQLLHKEKDGTEWFEGDIGKLSFSKHISGHPVWGDDEYFEGYRIGEVSFSKRSGVSIKNGFMFDENEETFTLCKSNKTISFNRAKNLGNVFENPELLTPKQS